jgi:acyl-CoA reductase-like NAD-dependent aldehyde dehydrogenase
MESIADNFISLMKMKVENFNVGYPVIANMSKGWYDKLLDAQRKGAKFLLGGPKYGSKHSLPPNILTGVTKDMTIWDEESFGPSIGVFIVNTDQEAIDLVNDTSYGFSTLIYTTNLERAVNVTKELDVRAGGVLFILF